MGDRGRFVAGARRFGAAALFVMLLAAPASGKSAMTAFDFAFTSIDGEAMPLEQYKGSALLVVNTASFCGFTPQFRALEALARKYADQGLVVIGVPSNDFGQQDPGSNAEIKQFCEANYDVDFAMTEKQKVVGHDAHPLYRWFAETLGAKGVPKWNFHKVLIGRDGQAIAGFPSEVAPDDKRLIGAVEEALAETPPS